MPSGIASRVAVRCLPFRPHDGTHRRQGDMRTIMSNNTNLNDFDTAISKLIHVAESGGIKTILADTTDNLLQEFAEMHKEGKLVKHKGYPLEVYFTDYIQQAITYVTDYVDALGLASKDEIAFLSIDAFEEGFVNSDDLERLHAKANIRKADKEESSCPGFAKDMKTAWIYVKDDLDNSAEITGEDRKTKNASHSPDFRSVIWNGKKYSFTAYQAACVSVLWKAFDNG